MGLNKMLYSDNSRILKSRNFVLADNIQLRKHVNTLFAMAEYTGLRRKLHHAITLT